MDDLRPLNAEEIKVVEAFAHEMETKVIPEVLAIMDMRHRAEIRQAIDDAYTPRGVKSAYQTLFEVIDVLEAKNADLQAQLAVAKKV